MTSEHPSASEPWPFSKLRSIFSKLLFILWKLLPGTALASFLSAVIVYSLLAETDDILYILPLFVIPVLHFVLGWLLPEDRVFIRNCERFGWFSLTLISVCWILFGLCRGALRGKHSFLWSFETFRKLADIFSVAALAASFGLVAFALLAVVSLVRPQPGQPRSSLKDDLRGDPAYSVLLLFVTLFQVICLLGFSLALHDLPTGRGLKADSARVDLGRLLFETKTAQLVEDSAPALEKFRAVVGDWQARKEITSMIVLLTLPPENQLRIAETRPTVENAISEIDQALGNYSTEIQVVHSLHPSSARLSPGTNALETIGTLEISLSAVGTHRPQLLDYIYFMTSTLVTTGYCDLVPVSNYSKLLCTVANLYEVFFTVIFFAVVISVLTSPRCSWDQPKPAKPPEPA